MFRQQRPRTKGLTTRRNRRRSNPMTLGEEDYVYHYGTDEARDAAHRRVNQRTRRPIRKVAKGREPTDVYDDQG